MGEAGWPQIDSGRKLDSGTVAFNPATLRGWKHECKGWIWLWVKHNLKGCTWLAFKQHHLKHIIPNHSEYDYCIRQCNHICIQNGSKRITILKQIWLLLISMGYQRIKRSKLANTIPWVELSWWGPNGPKVKYSPVSEAKKRGTMKCSLYTRRSETSSLTWHPAYPCMCTSCTASTNINLASKCVCGL